MIETSCLSKQYGRVAALQKLSLRITAGEIFGLLGPNGSGKTTALRLLMGLLRPTAGTATIAGLDCWQRSVAVHHHVGYLPGELRLYPNLNGYQTIGFIAKLRRADCLVRAEQLARRLGLDLKKRVAAMSTGMRQKLGLVLVLAAPAQLLILDEPTSGLDPTSRLQFLQLLHEAQAAGQTILLSSHIISEVEQVCGRVGLLRRGALVADQSMEALRDRRRVVIRFAGLAPSIPADLPGISEVTTHAAAIELTLQGPMGPVLQWLQQAQVDDLQVVPGGLLTLYRHYHGQEQPA